MRVGVCVGKSYIAELILQWSVVHVAVNETQWPWSFTEAQQIYNVRMSEPVEEEESEKMKRRSKMQKKK